MRMHSNYNNNCRTRSERITWSERLSYLDTTSLALVTAIARLGMRPTRRHLDAHVDKTTSPEGKGRESRGMTTSVSRYIFISGMINLTNTAPVWSSEECILSLF